LSGRYLGRESSTGRQEATPPLGRSSTSPVGLTVISTSSITRARLDHPVGSDLDRLDHPVGSDLDKLDHPGAARSSRDGQAGRC
jgi:hypothetical protein